MPTTVLDYTFTGNTSPEESIATALHGFPVQWARDATRTSVSRVAGGLVGHRLRLSPGAIQLTYSRGPGWQRDRLEAADEARLTNRLHHLLDLVVKLDLELAYALRDGADPIVFEDWYWTRQRELADQLESTRHALGISAGQAARGRVGEWSRKSRARMTRRLATLDWSPMGPTADRVAGLVTLTYPGDYLAVCPTGEVAKRHLKAFRAWWERNVGEAYGCWKLERQRRGAPHFHLLLMVPHAGTRELSRLRAHARAAWANIVGATGRDRSKMERYGGVSIDLHEGARMTDPQRIAVYFSKHNAAGESEKAYQNEPMDGWLDPEDGGGVGRWWGYWRLKPIEMDAELTPDDAVEVQRLLRSVVKAQGRTRRVRRRRVDHKTGVISTRRVTERYTVRALGGCKPSGFVLSNDAAALATQLGRALVEPPDWLPGSPRPLP